MPQSKRDRLEIALLYEAGFSFKEIGDFLGISKQRVHQLLPIHVSRRQGNSRQGLHDKTTTEKRRKIVLDLLQVIPDWSFTKIWKILFPDSFVPVINHNSSHVSLYPTQESQVVTLWNAGLSYPDITTLTGLFPTRISACLSLARRKGIKVRYKRVNWSLRKGG